MSFQLRIAETSDAQSINDIYNYYVDKSTCTFDIEPNTLSNRVAWLDSRESQHPVIVCTVDGKNVGWASLSAWHSRKAYARTVEISVYVHHQWHHQGIGQMLLADLIERARLLGHRVLLGLTCVDQSGSIRLQESCGFVKVGQLNKVGYKFGRWLDVGFFQLSLDNPPDGDRS